MSGETTPQHRGRVRAMLALLRPKQWTKNALLFAALIFSFQFLSVEKWLQAGVGLAVFCLLASTGYIYNDLRDVEADRKHPTKRKRPLASGEVTTAQAWGMMVVGFGSAIALGATLGPAFVAVSILYFITTLSYSFYFKHIVILDIMFLSSAYIWRAVAGAVAIGVPISPWLLVCTSFGALFLGFNKRRGEILLLDGKSGQTRRVLQEYSPAMLQEFQAITTSGTIISYAIYTVMGSPTPWLLLTLPLVVYGIFRYIYLIDQRGEGAAPDETLLRDRGILATAVLYVLCAVAVLLFAPHTPIHP